VTSWTPRLFKASLCHTALKKAGHFFL
jgi:hypothetical protein